MKRRTAVIGGVVVGAAAIATTIIALVLVAPSDPRPAAERYLAALADGDTESLAALTGSLDDGTALEAFAGAHQYIQDAQIEDIATGQDGFATVRATAVFDGERRDLSFALARTGNDWELGAEFLGFLAIRATFGAPVQVGGVVVDDGEASLFPAVYEVEAAPEILAGSTKVAVTTRREAVDLDLEVAPDAVAVLQPQLESYAAKCTAGGASIPPQCGLRIPWAADLASMERVAFRVERMPQTAVAADARSFAATGGVLVATVTGATRSGQPGSFTYRDDAWTLRGAIAFDGIDTILEVH